MPFSSSFEHQRAIERMIRLRHNRVASYSIAIGTVTAATLARALIGGEVIEGVPFITYFPAIVIATLLGGFWPGVVATLLSSAIAWFAFLPPTYSWALDERSVISLILFIFVGGVNVVVVALLNRVVEQIMTQEKSVRTLIESAPNGIVVVGEDGEIRLINASTEKLFGYDRSELIGRPVEVLVPVPRSQLHRGLRESFQERPETRSMGAGRDLSGRRKDGSEFPLEIGLNPIAANGRSAILATVIDISERRQAVERQQFLIRELKHRTQNLFAVIQAVATRSLVEGQTVAEVKAIFAGRLAALAQAHAMLAEEAWEGAPLVEIIRRELSGFASRINITGCELFVNSNAAQQFALIIHELATNAIKYGALSVPDGEISIAGRTEQSNGQAVFAFSWKETGGPTPKQPVRKGFGTAILIDAAKQFGRSVSLNYPAEGLFYELELSLLAIKATQRAEETALNVVRIGGEAS